jgi:hypothetical protein
MLYKFFWKAVVDTISNDKIEIAENLEYDIKDDHFSIYSLFWWMRYAEK